MKVYKVYIFIILMLMGHLTTIMAQDVLVRGRVIDQQGAPLPFSLIKINDSLHTTSDINGFFKVRVNTTRVNVKVSYIGYAPVDTFLHIMDTSQLITIVMKEGVTLKEVKITHRISSSNEAKALVKIRNSSDIISVVSSREIKRSGASDVSEAVKIISGASEHEDNLVIRGLSDRYVKVLFNGIRLPSIMPYSNSIPLDIFPVDIVDMLSVVKSPSAELPADVSGGAVIISTKKTVDKPFITVEAASSYNPNYSFQDVFLSFDCGDNIFNELFSSSCQLPLLFKDTNTYSLLKDPSFYIKARRNEQYAKLLDSISKSLAVQMSPDTINPYTDVGISLTTGIPISKGSVKANSLLYASIERNLDHYSDAQNSTWIISGNGAAKLIPYTYLKETTSQEKLLGTLLWTFNASIKEHSTFTFTVFHTSIGERKSTVLVGQAPGILSRSDALLESRVLRLTQRQLTTYILEGSHKILSPLKVTWNVGIARTSQKEPDTRFFANENISDTLFFISQSEYDLPYHYIRNMSEHSVEGNLDIAYDKKIFHINFGGSIFVNSRTFREWRYYVRNYRGKPYNGNPDSFFSANNMGIIGYDSIFKQYIIANYVVNNSTPRNNYDFAQRIIAGFSTITFKKKQFEIKSGIRIEHTIMEAVSQDTSLPQAYIKDLAYLPTLSIIYNIRKNWKIKTNISRSIARPNPREIAPFASYDFIGGFIYVGNPELKLSYVWNAEVRTDWFISPIEILSLGIFYKNLVNPIGMAFNPRTSNPEISFINLPYAYSYGAEIELRLKLKRLSHIMKNFYLYIAGSVISTKSGLNPEEYNIWKQYNPDLKPYRPLWGQAPFTFNTILSYKNSKLPEINIAYHVEGPKLIALGVNGAPDIYQKAIHNVTISIKKTFKSGAFISLKGENLLNYPIVHIQRFKGKEYIVLNYRSGPSITIKIGYKFTQRHKKKKHDK